MTDRGRLFGQAARSYERFRPDYPAELVDMILEYAEPPTATAVEIGAGTGKLTRLLTARGLRVTATDPDPAMLDELVRRTGGAVTVVAGALEDLDSLPAADLVVSAAALHWTQESGRWDRVVRLLRPGGTFANCGGSLQLADDEAVKTVNPAPAQTSGATRPQAPSETVWQWPGPEMLQCADLVRVQQRHLSRRLVLTTDDYLGYLATRSEYVHLSPRRRRVGLARIQTGLPRQVECVIDLTVHLAVRAGGLSPSR